MICLGDPSDLDICPNATGAHLLVPPKMQFAIEDTITKALGLLHQALNL